MNVILEKKSTATKHERKKYKKYNPEAHRLPAPAIPLTPPQLFLHILTSADPDTPFKLSFAGTFTMTFPAPVPKTSLVGATAAGSSTSK